MSAEGGKAEACRPAVSSLAVAHRRARLAWLASLVVHGWLVLAIRRRDWTWPPVPPAPSRPVELEVITPVPPTVRLPMFEATPAQPAAKPRLLLPRHTAPALPARGAPPLTGPSTPSTGAVPAPSSADAPQVPSLMQTRGVPGPPAAPAVTNPPASAPEGASLAPAPGVKLSWDGLSLAARDRLAGATPDGPAPARQPRISVDRLRAARERDEDAVANVRVGRVDPYLHDYVRDARVRFEAGARHIADQLPLDAQKTAETWVHGYATRVAEVNAQATAARLGARRDPDSRGDGPPEPSTERRPDVLGAYGESARAAEAGAVQRRVTVCLTVAPGHDTTVAVKRESGDPALDQLAREAFSRAAVARGVPADAHAAVACYDLRIRAFRMPPLPVLTCGIDKDGPTCAWPFKKITSVSVHLESVDYPSQKGDESLLRRAH